MIVMTVGQIVNSTESIKNVLAAKLPVKAAYQLSRVGKALAKELESFNEVRNKLIAELGEEKDGQISVSAENIPEFSKQMADLTDSEVKIDLEPVKIEILGDKAEVSAADLMACEAFIQD